MSDTTDSRAWSARPFLNHLNERHPDTVLFLARHVATSSAVQGAALVTVEADQLVLRVETADESITVSCALGSAVASRADLVAELRRMLVVARAAKPDEPLTSLEADIASRHPSTRGR